MGAQGDAAAVLKRLERMGKKKTAADHARYGIDAWQPFGVTVGELKKLAKELGRDHALAAELWKARRYEARMLATLVDEPERVTVKQMNAWADEFDNWAIVDTACFSLFDRVPGAWKRIPVWAKAKPEFKKRAAFALLWSLSTHDKQASDAEFVRCLPLLEKGAEDERHFVEKSVDMALRGIGKRNRKLNAAATALAERLAARDEPVPRRIGRNTLRELTSSKVRGRLRS